LFRSLECDDLWTGFQSFQPRTRPAKDSIVARFRARIEQARNEEVHRLELRIRDIELGRHDGIGAKETGARLGSGAATLGFKRREGFDPEALADIRDPLELCKQPNPRTPCDTQALQVLHSRSQRVEPLLLVLSAPLEVTKTACRLIQAGAGCA